MMLIFMATGPMLGPRIMPDLFSQLQGVGLLVFYIGNPVKFGALFLFYLFLYGYALDACCFILPTRCRLLPSNRG